MTRDEFMNAHEIRMEELEKICEDLNEILGDPVEGFEDDGSDSSLERESGAQGTQEKNSQDLDDLLNGLESL